VRAGDRMKQYLLPALMLAVAGSAYADFQDDYTRGLQAVETSRWVEARKYLQAALTAQPEPVEKVFVNGAVSQPYVPYHFLGLVAINLGECDVATTQWSNPTHRRMISRLRYLQTQEHDALAACKSTAASKEEKPSSPAETTETPSTKSPIVENPPTKTPPVADKRPPEKTTPDAGKPTNATAHAAAPAPLSRAFEDFVAGRYSEAARVDPEFFNDARARFHAYLLRSAARYMLAQIGGDRNLLDEARGDARAAQALEQAAPDAAVFSPKFRAFYGGVQ
jgi:hypothetical protein